MVKDEGGFRLGAAYLLGFDVPCICGHDEGLHDTAGKCHALTCECDGFREQGQDNETH